MSSPNLSLTDFGSLDISCEVLSTKETQTSSEYITDSIASVKDLSRPLPKGIDKSSTAPVSTLDCCHILKHPSDTKTADAAKPSFSNVIKLNDSDNNSEDSESNRQRYCKEVIKPYLNTHLNDCEDNVDSLEKLIQSALEDFPDYQPCEENKKINKEKKQSDPIKMETSKKPPEVSNKDSAKVKKCPRKSEDNSKSKPSPCPSSTNLIKTPVKPACPDNIQLPPDHEEESDKAKEPTNNLSRESITQCVKDSLTAIKRSASSCLETIEVVIGIKKAEKPGQKPTYCAIEKSKLKCSPSQNVQTETGNSLKDLYNEHSEKIEAIKETVKDLAGKFCKTTKNAVTLITSESAKILNKVKTECNTANEENQPKPKEKKPKKASTESVKGYLFQKAQDKPKTEDPPKCEDLTQSSTPTIESSPSLLQQRLNFSKMRDDIVRSKFEKSSPFDKSMPREISNKVPQPVENRIPTVSAIDHNPEPESTASMFTMLKAKFFSMFQDEGEKAVMEPIAQESPEQDDDEEDPFERFYEQ